MLRQGETLFRRRNSHGEAVYAKGSKLPGRIKYGFHRYKFAFYCDEWMKLERGIVKESTYIKYDNILRKHIRPVLGEYPPQEISTQHVELFKQELLRQKLSVKSVRDILVVLRSILRYAARQYPGVFPEVEIIYPREPKKEARVLTLEEQRQLASYLRADMDTCKFGVYFALLTGLRIGELCALRWANISLRERTVRVDATMQRIRDLEQSGSGRTKIAISSPKSGTSLRLIPLTDSMVHLCGQYDPHCPSAFLLTGTEAFMEPRQVQRRFAKYTRECNLEGVHFHTIRHTFATRCVEAGFEIKSLSEILGHANTSVTLGRYVHSSMDLKRENMDKLEAVYL